MSRVSSTEGVTAASGSTSGQSDLHANKETTKELVTETPSANQESSLSSGDGKATTDDTSPTAEDAGSANAETATDAIRGGIQMGTEPARKKKKNRPKKKGAAARKNVTGFEEFYADAPITPAEAAEEKKELYNSSRPFIDRIEECIQRFRARRRMDSERTNLFNKYLWLGGIDSSPRQFTGFAEDRAALEEADADDIRRLTAIDTVGEGGSRFYSPTEQDHWFVDFEGIVKGFLSRLIPGIYMYDEKANHLAADLVKNFLNYVLMHDVCPEYAEDITAARHICDISAPELRLMHELTHALPGTFNAAVVSLFCDGGIAKCDEDEIFGKLVAFRVTVLSSAVSGRIKEQLMSSNDLTTIHVISTKEETYEVVDIIKPRQNDIKMVEMHLQKAGYAGKGKPAGVLRLRSAIIDYGIENQSRAGEVDFSKRELEDYLLENDLLVKFDKGVKIRAVVCELSVGLRFIKAVEDIRPSFDLFLPQMLMDGWKDPVPNERPPPSATNPGAEDKAFAAEI
ncbi:hypothetical protein M426DRAFT_318902 [Hypoxylon sp. CI-4A]|nr:hypothetical protein M426DRAFT_318902 [Hypoxylon sp. CI-4A]